METFIGTLPFHSPWVAILIILLVILSAFLQGMGGVGFTMILAPVAMMVSPVLVPGPLLALGCTVSIMAMIREWQAIAWNYAIFGFIGRTVGAAIAVMMMVSLSGHFLNIFFSVLILIAVLLSASGLTIKTSSTSLSVAGTISGIMSTLTSVGSPPLVIALQHDTPAVIRATLSAILTGGTLASIIFLAIGGQFGSAELFAFLWLSPFLFIGFWLSTISRHYVNRKRLRISLLTFCFISALALLVKTVF